MNTQELDLAILEARQVLYNAVLEFDDAADWATSKRLNMDDAEARLESLLEMQ